MLRVSPLKLASAFSRDQRGAVAITFALLTVSLFGFVGLAVDATRGYNVQQRLGQGLDAAALAGAKQLDAGATDTEIANVVQAFFAQHMTNMNINSVTINSVNVTVDRNSSTVNAVARGTVATTFAKVVGISSMPVKKMAEVSYRLRRVELAMSLDISGSMGTGGKIQTLRDATKDVIDAMFDESASTDHVKIAIVPWSSTVNAGSMAPIVSNNLSTDQCVIERLGSNRATGNAPFGADALRVGSTATYLDPRYQCHAFPVVPLQNRDQRNSLKAAVDNLQPTHGTAGHLGIAWGQYMVSPEWGSVLPSSSQPRPYNPTETLKVVVLQTDGEFNQTFSLPGAYDPPREINESYQIFQEICTSMRQNKVQIYTVGFQLVDPRARTELEACSNGSGRHFNAATNDELKAAFRQIATQILQLRLSR
ncbi:MAG: hypothetical protein RL291_740 [Pseudomonadota bacterium]